MSKNNKAILLVSLGTPTEPTPRGVARFLRLFLSDPRVVEAPRLLWWFLLRCVIIPLRARRVARAYQKIWTDSGSPLSVISQKQATKLQQTLERQMPGKAPGVFNVETYGEISLAERVTALREEGYEHFTIIPMYPQYSGSTTGAIYDQVAKLFLRSRNVPDIRLIKAYYVEPGYIDALAESVCRHWREQGRNQRLLMSFHGVPQEYVEKGDPYEQHCRATAVALAEKLDLKEDEWAYAFQSRFGPKQWLQPYTDNLLQQWAEQGIVSVDVISPAFTADCLETLEELNIAARELFLSKGGQNFAYISSLNDSEFFIEFLAEISLQT